MRTRVVLNLVLVAMATACASTPPAVPVNGGAAALTIPPEKREEAHAEMPAEPKAREQNELHPPAAYEVTQETYDKTFTEVEELIEALNAIIRAGDFATWQSYVSSAYSEALLDPDNLRKINEQPIIRGRNIVIQTLQDYFVHVVMPSRTNVRLDEIIFEDEYRVQAFMDFRGTKILLYQLEKIGDSWKISTW